MDMSHKGTNYGNHRPPLLEKDPSLQDRIVSLVREGHYIETVCAAQGINKVTFYNWVNAGLEGREPFLSFLHALQKAEADAEIQLGRRVLEQSDLNQIGWTGKMTFMERRWRERWGRSEIVKIEASPERQALASALKNVAQAIQGRTPKALPQVVEAEVVREVEDV